MAQNVAVYLAHQAGKHPDACAVRAPFRRGWRKDLCYEERSFSELEIEVSAAARLLTERGIVRGARVLLMVRPGLDLIRIVFAVFKVGAVPVIIDPGMGLNSFLKSVRQVEPEALLAIPTAMHLARAFRRSFRDVAIRVKIGSEFGDQLRCMAEGGSYPVVESQPDELAAILFTSGSTGPAKGVCYRHGMFAAQIEAIQRQYGIQPGEVDLPMLPVFALFNPALGMTTVVPEMNPSRPADVDPEKIVAAIRRNEVTNSFGSPALWSKIAAYCAVRKVTLPSVRRILMAGAPVAPELMRAMLPIIPNGMIHTPYGATEALPLTSISADEVLKDTAEQTARGAGTCVGRPLPRAEVRIIRPSDTPIPDWEDAVELCRGEVGEIVARGPSVTRSYEGRPDADVASKIRDGNGFWHRMGDLGWFDEDGRLWFCGRMAERVLTADGPLYTDCCEAIFNAHPRVYRTALIDCGGGRPAIVVEPKKEGRLRGRSDRRAFTGELRKLAKSSPATARIDAFFFKKRFPVDVRHNAKIHRLALAREFALR
ncbi:MAG: fatty acid CoA ligase family protein [Opitutales bacterium]